VYDKDSKPQRPRAPFDIEITPRVPLNLRVKVQEFPGHWQIEVNAGKLQPSAESHVADPLYIGSPVTQDLEVVGRIFADNLPKPADVTFRFQIEAVPGALPLTDENE
jgi:hypothetical protein